MGKNTGPGRLRRTASPSASDEDDRLGDEEDLHVQEECLGDLRKGLPVELPVEEVRLETFPAGSSASPGTRARRRRRACSRQRSATPRPWAERGVEVLRIRERRSPSSCYLRTRSSRAARQLAVLEPLDRPVRPEPVQRPVHASTQRAALLEDHAQALPVPLGSRSDRRSRHRRAERPSRRTPWASRRRCRRSDRS